MFLPVCFCLGWFYFFLNYITYSNQLLPFPPILELKNLCWPHIWACLFPTGNAFVHVRGIQADKSNGTKALGAKGMGNGMGAVIQKKQGLQQYLCCLFFFFK